MIAKVTVRAADLAYVFVIWGGDLERSEWDHLFTEVVLALTRHESEVSVWPDAVKSLLSFASNFTAEGLCDVHAERLEQTVKEAGAW